MNKKLLVILVTVLLISVICISFVSCNQDRYSKDSQDNATSDTQLKSIYDSYVAYADSNSETPLSYEEWLTSIQGTDGRDGVDGREVEFNVSSEYIQWRYVGETTWNNLIAIDSLKGEDGKDGKDGRDGLTINPSGDPLDSGVGLVANTMCAKSVSRIFMYESSTSSSYSSLASAFLITDSTTSQTERYLVTNAHCVRYLKPNYTYYNRGFGGGQTVLTGYEWASYGKIIGYFENDETAYNMEIVAYGAYDPGSDYSYYYGITKENNQADFAILKITGTQPSNEDHPALTLANGVRGDSIAIIGNPEGIGSTNSISVGVISQTGISIKSWGAGTFLMTDAAINGGNSGGPVVDCSGNVVGIVESKLVASDIENMGFALDTASLLSFISWVETTYTIDINYSFS